jgi:hypothetical protein
VSARSALRATERLVDVSEDLVALGHWIIIIAIIFVFRGMAVQFVEAPFDETIAQRDGGIGGSFLSVGEVLEEDFGNELLEARLAEVFPGIGVESSSEMSQSTSIELPSLLQSRQSIDSAVWSVCDTASYELPRLGCS